MTLCAVRAAMYKEQRVWELTGKEAIEEIWLRQRYKYDKQVHWAVGASEGLETGGVRGSDCISGKLG